MTLIFYIVFFLLPVVFLDFTYFTQANWSDGSQFGITTLDATFPLTGPIAFGLLSLVAALFVGDRLFRRFRGSRRLFLPGLSEDRGGLRVLIWTACGLHLLFLWNPSLAGRFGLSQAVEPLGLFGLGLAVLLMARGGLPVADRIAAFLVFLPIKIALHLGTGLFAGVAFIVLFLLSFRALYRPKNALRLFAVAVLLGFGVFVVKPTVDVYRYLSWTAEANGEFEGKSALEAAGMRAAMMVFAAENYTFYPPPRGLTGAMVPRERSYAKRALRRLLVQYSTFVYVADRIGGGVPLWDGHTYRNLLANLVPRVFWKDKPTEQLGQAFAHRFRIVFPDDTTTSWNLPWITELYVNFGLAGITLGMFLIGLMLSLFDRLINRPESGLLPAALFGAVLMPLIYPESNLTLMIGNLHTKALFLILFTYAGITGAGVLARLLRRRVSAG